MVALNRRRLISGAAAVAAYKALPARAFSHGKVFYNFTGSNLPNLRAAQAATKANTRDTRILAWGDSTVAGQGATNSGINQSNFTWIPQLTGLVPNSSFQFISGDGGEGSCRDLGTVDNRFSGDTGCQADEAQSLGGYLLGSDAPATDGFHFTPTIYAPGTATVPFDTVEIGYAVTSIGGNFTLGFDGGAPAATFNGNGAAAFATGVVTTSLGSHTIDIANVTGFCLVDYLLVRQAATKQNLMMRAGWGGGSNSTVLSNTTNPYSGGNVVPHLAPDLTIIEGAIIDDWLNPEAGLATSLANFESMVTQAQMTGDVILLTGTPTEVGAVIGPPSQDIENAYYQQVRNLAYTLGVPCIDTYGIFGDWNGANARSWMSDQYHPDFAGYTQIANAVALVLNTPGFTAP